MQTQININNKKKFFGCYIGQFMSSKKMPHFTSYVGSTIFSNDIRDMFLILKPLTSIIDEDAKDIGFLNAKNFLAVLPETDGFFISLDQLRSKGYLVSWMDLSVEQIINAGWVKYKE